MHVMQHCVRRTFGHAFSHRDSLIEMPAMPIKHFGASFSWASIRDGPHNVRLPLTKKSFISLNFYSKL